MRRIQIMQVPDAPPDEWISFDSHMELQALKRISSPKDRRIALGVIIGKTKDQFTLFYEAT